MSCFIGSLFIIFSFSSRKLIVFMVTSPMLPSTRLIDEEALKHLSGCQCSVVLSGGGGGGRFFF